jgi:hypothetical protein
MTITLTREEAQQVLDALEAALSDDQPYIVSCKQTVETLRARLSAPEPAPVAWQSRMRPDWEENGWTQWKDCTKEQADNFWKTPRLHDWVYEARALYTAPPQREWQGLTSDERDEIYNNNQAWVHAVEDKLKEKNNG